MRRCNVPKPIRKPKIWSGTPKIWPRKPKSWSGLSPTFRMTSLEPRSSTRNLLCSKTRNCCYKGHKGRRGLTEGLDVLHGSFRGPLEANGPYEAGLCDLQGHRGRILTFCMTSEASRGRGVCGRAEFLKKDSFKKRKDYSASHATNQSGWPCFFLARFKNLENLKVCKIYELGKPEAL